MDDPRNQHPRQRTTPQELTSAILSRMAVLFQSQMAGNDAAEPDKLAVLWHFSEEVKIPGSRDRDVDETLFNKLLGSFGVSEGGVHAERIVPYNDDPMPFPINIAKTYTELASDGSTTVFGIPLMPGVSGVVKRQVGRGEKGVDWLLGIQNLDVDPNAAGAKPGGYLDDDEEGDDF